MMMDAKNWSWFQIFIFWIGWKSCRTLQPSSSSRQRILLTYIERRSTSLSASYSTRKNAGYARKIMIRIFTFLASWFTADILSALLASPNSICIHLSMQESQSQMSNVPQACQAVGQYRSPTYQSYYIFAYRTERIGSSCKGRKTLSHQRCRSISIRWVRKSAKVSSHARKSSKNRPRFRSSILRVS